MTTVKKVSEITVERLISYLRISDANVDDDEKSFIESLLIIAKEYIKKITSVGDAIDDYPEFVIAVYVLVEDMYDNRTLNVDQVSRNKVVDTILGLHDWNLL